MNKQEKIIENLKEANLELSRWNALLQATMNAKQKRIEELEDELDTLRSCDPYKVITELKRQINSLENARERNRGCRW